MASLNTDITTTPPTCANRPSPSIIQAPLHRLMQIVESRTKTQLNLHAASDERRLLDAIEGQISATYRTSITTLRSRRNQLCAVNRLPDRVLLTIFSLCRPGKKAYRRMTRYVYLAWVCRSWRVLALGHAELWSSIDLAYRTTDKRAMMEEFVRRSAGARLSVTWLTLTAGEEEMLLFKEFIGPSFARLESLELKLSAARWRELIPVMRQPTPFLRRCHLTKVEKDDSSASCEQDVVLPDLFGGVTQLHEVKLEHVHTSWNTLVPTIQGLRTLTLIAAESDSDAARLTREQVLGILEACPELEFLHLETHLDSESIPDTTCSAQPSLTMTRLLRIFIHSQGDSDILGHLTTPVLKQLHLNLEYVTTALIDGIARCFNFSALREMAVGFRKGEPSRSQPFTFSGTYNIMRPPRKVGQSTAEDIPLQIICEDLAPPELLGRTLMERAINVSTLTFRGDAYSDMSRLGLHRQILRHAVGVRNLVISTHSATVPLLKELVDPAVCPKLECISYEVCGHDRELATPLESSIRNRKKGDVPIKLIQTYY